MEGAERYSSTRRVTSGGEIEATGGGCKTGRHYGASCTRSALMIVCRHQGAGDVSVTHSVVKVHLRYETVGATTSQIDAVGYHVTQCQE